MEGNLLQKVMMKYYTTHTVSILHFSYMTDIQANLFNIVFLVGGGITVWSTGATLAILNREFSYYSSQSLTQSPGYSYIATTFAGSLIAMLFLVRWYMSYIYSFIENRYCFKCKYTIAVVK